jgi:hypothetical protein
MAITDKLYAIADAIRGKTGGTTPLTLDGMAAAIAGIQTGGGGTNGIYMAEVTLAENKGAVVIDHSLGTTDIMFAAMWAQDLNGITPDYNCCLGKFWFNTGIATRAGGNSFCCQYNWNTTNGYASGGAPTSGAYVDRPDNENTFTFKLGGSAVASYIAGVTYKVVIMAKSAFSVTEV